MKKKIIVMVIMLAALVLELMLPIKSLKVEAASMKLSTTKITMEVGKTKKLTVNNLASGSTVKWSISDKNVATVSAKGKVTAKKTGSATITATVTAKSGKKSKLTCKVTVKAAATVANSKYRYVGVVYEGDYDLTISKVDKNGIPTELIIFGEKIKLVNSRFEGDMWITETEKGGYMEACFMDNYEKIEIKGNYGGEYKRTTRTNNDPLMWDKTIMKKYDSVEIQEGDTIYQIIIRYNKSNAYYLNKIVGRNDDRKWTTDTYPVTDVFKGDGWSFDCTTCTLTLNNAKLKHIETETSCDMTVNLIGDSVICNDLADGSYHSRQIGWFSNRDGVDKVNVTFAGDGSVDFSAPVGFNYKEGFEDCDRIGLRIDSNPLILKGNCTITASGRKEGIECSNMDITVGQNCTLKAFGKRYGTVQSSPSYSRKLTIDGTFIAEATGDEDYASAFEGTEYSYEGGVSTKKPITPELVIGNGNSIFAGSSEATAEKVDVDAFKAARYVRIGKE
ncbi:MAG TPA: Ig-like domain-containing protein [Mobilitalea sp.]|nr:Ig-like domain-containing protein [Mobilitalea sp.]